MKICAKDKCTGCFACYNACAKRCIQMGKQHLGHLYPVIDEAACIECGTCSSVCPANQKLSFRTPKIVYAAWSCESVDRASSSSGGAASVFSSYIVESGGVAVGAVINENFEVEHRCVENKDELMCLKGSKYVHSHINGAYQTILIRLNADKKVLFIGTPCQNAGLKTFLKEDYENLWTIDLICHGVPPQDMLKQHVKKVLGKDDLRNLKFSFRDGNKFIFKVFNGDDLLYSASVNEDMYYMAFWNALSFRESCYTCQYARPERISDITIGDFWGLDIENKNGFKIDKGISCILINTERGQKLFEEVSSRFVYVPRTLTEAVNGNANLHHPSLMHNKYHVLKQKVHSGIEYDAALRVCFKKEILKQRIKEIDNIIHIPIVATATKLKRAILGR